MTPYEIDKLFYHLIRQTNNTALEYLKKWANENNYTFESVSKDIVNLIDKIVSVISTKKTDGVFYEDDNGKRIFDYNYYCLRFTEQCENEDRTKYIPIIRTDNYQNYQDKKWLLNLKMSIESEYKRVTESTTAEIEPTLKGIKRPNNTHNVQFALLERLGIIDYLKKEYNLPDTKMSELIANILNKDIQNTRTMLSLTATKNQESNLPKNQDIVNEILIKTGTIQKD
ncbi:MAG: hypothetical protein ACOYOV_15640 [Bacteroidales bacterium]